MNIVRRKKVKVNKTSRTESILTDNKWVYGWEMIKQPQLCVSENDFF